MRKEFKEIDKILKENGWVQTVAASEDEMSEFVKAYGDNTIGIEIALNPCSIGVYGNYGVCSVMLCKFANKMPYIRDDLKWMQELICKAENELIKVGVPFRPTYGFGTHLEHNLGENLKLREKYHLDQYEKEDFANE